MQHTAAGVIAVFHRDMIAGVIAVVLITMGAGMLLLGALTAGKSRSSFVYTAGPPEDDVTMIVVRRA